MNYEEWIRLGERLQLTGEDLALFVRKKEDEHIAREERVRKREDERRMIEMQHELQMKERELQIEKLKLQNRSNASSEKLSHPKLPIFDERVDNMDAYIERFERFAQGQGWSIDTWATYLSSLLSSGKGLEVYTSLTPAQAVDYSELKMALLRRYQLTEEAFRVKFRKGKPEAGETVYQYVARLRRYLSRWIELSGTEEKFDALFDLVLREQVVQSCSSGLATFLKERAPRSIDEVTRLAEQYVEAHGGQLAVSESTIYNTATTQVNRSHDQPGMMDKGRTCFICNRRGHIARECRSRRGTDGAQWSEPVIGAACTQREAEQEAPTPYEEPLPGNGAELHIVAGGCTIETLKGARNLDIRQGFVGTKKVKVLRDTGCELAAVRPEFVSKEQYLNKRVVMVTIDGEARVVNTAKIKVDTPYFAGEIEVMVPKTLICDLIIGNIPGAKDKPDPTWDSMPVAYTVSAAMTRSQTRKASRPFQALKVPTSTASKELNPDELKARHKEDPTLAKLWLSKDGKEKEAKNGAEYKYEEKIRRLKKTVRLK